ncbi:MAG: alpha/beta hydrolase [Deltaproteobacteria bacterium]|nr:alpha/beta hydrolase [Candidatus Tharpella aukensis]
MSVKVGTVCFSHGKESGPWGSKIKRLAKVAEKCGFAVESIDYRGIADPDERVAKLVDWQPAVAGHLVLVGSSMGSYVAAVAARKISPDGLFLLAPAIAIPGFGRVQDPLPKAGQCTIIHGWHDEIIAPQLIVDYARRHALTLHLLPGDHRLMEVLPAIEVLFENFLTSLIHDELVKK